MALPKFKFTSIESKADTYSTIAFFAAMYLASRAADTPSGAPLVGKTSPHPVR